MEIEQLVKYVSLVFLIIFSAFFSGSEVAFFSIDKKKAKDLLSDHSLILKYSLRLLEYPRRLLVAILIGNNVVNIAASIISVTIALGIAKDANLSEELVITVQIILLTAVIILFGELIPKIWATKAPLSFMKAVAFPLYWISALIFPVSELITELLVVFYKFIKTDKSKGALTREDIHHLAKIGHERGTLEDHEQELIQSLVSVKTVIVREIMRPRVDMVAVSTDSSLEEVLQTISESGHSRIPLYKEDLDEIVGIIYAKDLLKFLKDKTQKERFSPLTIARKALFIPETKLSNELMKEFQEKKMHLAIVVDEYGGTSGLVTLEDILEEIIGEIRDEYDKEEEEISKISENTYIAKGSISISELNENLNLGIDLSNADYDTLGGFVFNQAEEIPKEGYSFEFNQTRFTVKEVANKRIKKIQIDMKNE
ncbi:MAG: HlyC/CorC family transporter [Ignavibacteriales bacterium]|nr:hemolysin family protein [Ignavibacteriaceae bacterium]NLH60947.1 HlyC/CorC family transporter [Ignavibacteriales bacterium]HOJ18889.1 hemolysin family protein [Ignavibacteriaceae bacterium]HPO56871.1 hemolysin family protein [Ignavibacteriaceae bacterium]